MKIIPFPTQYHNALLTRTKNTTLRIGAEIGKYKIRNKYSAESYAGKKWNITIKITSVSRIALHKLDEFGIPKQSIESLKKNGRLTNGSPVEVIHFKIL